MKIIKGRTCLKCNSKNVYLDYDMGVWNEHCLICGYTVPLKEVQCEKKEADYLNKLLH